MSDLNKLHIKNLFKLCRSRYCKEQHCLKGEDLLALKTGQPCLMLIEPDPEDDTQDLVILAKIIGHTVNVGPEKFNRKLKVLCINGSLPDTVKEFPLNVSLSESAYIGMRPCDVFLIPNSDVLLK